MRALALVALLSASCAFAQSIRPSAGSGSGLPAGGVDGQVVGHVTGSPAWIAPPAAAPGTNGQVYETQGGIGAWRYGRGTGVSAEVNVKDYGAKCDGVTDDTTAINNALASGAARVFIPGGTCVITGITIPIDSASLDAASFELVGLGFPKLLVTSALNAVGITVAKQRYVTIRNLQIYSSGTKADGNNTVGIKYVANTSRQSLDHVRVVNFSGIGIEQIQGLVHDYRNIDVRSNTWAVSIEKNGATAPTTTTIDNAYITSCTRGISADSLVSGHFNRVTFESCGSSTTSDGALHLLSGTRGVEVSAAYFESTDGRNIVATDARWTMTSPVFIGTAGAADQITYSGVSATQRGHASVANDIVTAHHYIADPDATQDADLTLARTSAATTGAVNLANAQKLAIRNAANSADVTFGLNGSDRYASGTNVFAYLSEVTGIPLSTVTTAGDLVVGTGASTVTRLAAGTLGYVLTSNGAGVAPTWQAATGGSSGGVTLQSQYPGTEDHGNLNIDGAAHFGLSVSSDGDFFASGAVHGQQGIFGNSVSNVTVGPLGSSIGLTATQPAASYHALGGGVRAQALATPGAATITNVGPVGAVVSGISLTFAATGNTITAPTSHNFASDLYEAGGQVVISGTASNNGMHYITAINDPGGIGQNNQMVVTPALVNETTSAGTLTGSTGVSVNSYFVVAVDAYGNKSLPSPVATTSTANQTLSVNYYNNLTWPAVEGAVSYDVLKGDTAHFLVNVPAPQISAVDQSTSAGTAYTVATVNQTADITADGALKAAGGLKALVFAGTTTVQQLIQTGTKTLATGAGTVTYATAFSAAPVCTCTDSTATAATQCSTTATVLTLAGTSTDVINWICVGAK